MTADDYDYLDAVRVAMAAEQEEWNQILREMVAAGLSPTAHDVSREHRRRMAERGDTSPTSAFLLALEVMES